MMGKMNNIFAKRSEANKNNSDLQTRRINRSGSKASSVDHILYLQRTIGNQAVQRLIRSKALQAKLMIGQPGDVYEQEADRVADAVMRMPEPHVQKECSNYSENEFVQTKPTLSILRSITNIRSSIPHVQRYGANVHQTLTERWGREIFPEDYGAVASEIARYDQLLDEGWTHPTLTTLASFRFSGYDSPHFLDRNAAIERVESSISSVNRRDFGGALHSFQDSFSHRFPPGAGYNNEDNVVPADHSTFERALVVPARVLQHVYPDTLSGRGAALRHVVLGHYPDHFKGPSQTGRDTEMEAETKRLLRRFGRRYTERMRQLEESHSEQSSTGRPHGTMAPSPRIIPRKEIIPTKAEGQTPQVTSSIQSKINSLKSGGQPLSIETRNFFEPRFGSDFSGVRIHADSNANQLARSLNAKAFTRGNDIVFGSGEYKPENSSGKRLLGHELTHVVQQTQPVGIVQRGLTDTIQRLPPPGHTGRSFPINWDNRRNPWRAGRYRAAISLHGTLSISPFGIEITGDNDGLFITGGGQTTSLNFSNGEFYSFEEEVEIGPLTLGLSTDDEEATITVDVLGIVWPEAMQDIVEAVGEVTSDFNMTFARREGEVVLANIGMDLGLRLGPDQVHALAELSIATEYPEEGPATTTAEGEVSIHVNICGIEQDITVAEGEGRSGDIHTRHEQQLRQFALREAFNQTYNDLPGTEGMSIEESRSYLLTGFNTWYRETYGRLQRRVVDYYTEEGYDNASDIMHSNLTPLSIFAGPRVIVETWARAIIQQVILRHPEPPGIEVVQAVWNSIILPCTREGR